MPVTCSGVSVDGCIRMTTAAIAEHIRSNQHTKAISNKQQRACHAVAVQRAVAAADPYLMLLFRTALVAGKSLSPFVRFKEALDLQFANGVPLLAASSPYQNQ
jgi:hypothetical protein